MEYTIDQCKKDTNEHINQVREFLMVVINNLSTRALIHDQSKLESPEIELFTEYTPKLKNTTYGSDEYKGFLEGLREALKHHYQKNSHHPEHYKKYVCNGCFKEFKKMPSRCDVCMYSQFQEEADIKQMDLLDIVEMFCDWKAATLRHDDGDIYKSIDINQKRFRYSDDLAEIFRNTAKLFD
jgi:hypothetical protein